MEEIKNLTGEKAVEKIKEMAEKNTCMFATLIETNQWEFRPMATASVDDEGNLWFFSNAKSHKNQQIDQSSKVELVYMDAGKNHYFVLQGNASIIKDKSKAKELWNPMNKAWFEDGVDDPNVSMIKVTPAEAHFWDTKNGKLLTMVKIAFAAITGKQIDAGVEGDVSV